MRSCAVVFRSALLWLGLVSSTYALPSGGPFAPEVYSDGRVTVRAGIATDDGQIVHFGDVLSLAVIVSWNAEDVTVEEPGEQLFSNAWSEDFAPVLLDVREERRAGMDALPDELRYVFRFQIASCPGGKMTCPGDRRYALPELALSYRDQPGGEPVLVKFRPAPGALTLLTTIARDAAGELYPFSSYFPSGGYPDPLSVADHTRTSLMALGMGSIMFIGGMLMWPFRFRKKQLFAAEEEPRWRTVLHELQHDQDEDERRAADRMRRCLVWYCSDCLEVDPFEWLGAGPEGDAAHADFRALFHDLLHDPAGRVPELRARLTSLVTARA